MPKRFHDKLTDLLKTAPRFVDNEGELVTAAVINHAWQIDHDLVRLLLADAEVKAKFFDEIDGHWVFNINSFIDYISDKNFLANSYTRFRNRIGLNIGGKFMRERGEVSLVWPYKDCVLEGGQTKEEEKRKEIFFNEILAQDEIDRLFDLKALTGWKRYTVKGEQEVTEFRRDEDRTIQENLIIKGNNLLALHTLKQQFRGRVKLIYIDPPYNTGKDSFGYNDSFNHSSWLTFMKNRLEVARELLRDDGLFWISLSDAEVHYCKVLADEIFDRANFVADIIWNSTKSVTNTAIISSAHTHNLLYAKSSNILKAARTSFRLEADSSNFSNPDNDPRGKWVADPFQVEGIRPNQQYEIVNPKTGTVYKPNPGCSWKNEKKVFDKLLRDNRIVFGVSGKAGPQRKRFWTEAQERGRVTTTLWKDLSTTTNGTQHLKQLFSGKVFDNPKPEDLLERIIQLSTKERDIVLDYHSGSATTAAVAHKMNRQWITVEQMDYVETITLERLRRVVGKMEGGAIVFDTGGVSESVDWQGGGDFIYCELMRYNQAYVDEIQAAQSSEELVALWRDIAANSFLNWYVKPKTPDDAVDDFIAIGQSETGLDKQKKCLMDLLNKNQLYVNLSEIDDEDFAVSEADKALNEQFYEES